MESRLRAQSPHPTKRPPIIEKLLSHASNTCSVGHQTRLFREFVIASQHLTERLENFHIL